MKPLRDWTEQTVAERLVWRGEQTPSALALETGGRTFTYGELVRESLATAAALQQRGLGLRCRCVLAVEPKHLPALIFGVHLRGASFCLLNPQSPTDMLAQRVLAADATLAVASPSIAAAWKASGVLDQRLVVEPDPLTASAPRLPRGGPVFADLDDPSHLQTTSGTTGEPKLAVLTHRNVIAFARANSAAFPSAPEDRLIGWSPLHHVSGLTRFVFWAIYEGLPSRLLPPSIGSIPKWLSGVSDFRATITVATDSGYRIAARMVPPGDVDLSTLRYAVNGGEAVKTTTLEAFENRFGVAGVLRPSYGLTEATLAATINRVGEEICVRDGVVSTGSPLPGVSLRIVDDDGEELPPGRPGDLLIRSEQVFAGYWNDPRATADVLSDGWLRTGDVATVDADGRLYVLDRKRVMIKRGGAMIAPRDIEDVLVDLAAGRGCAAVGLPSESLGGEDVVVVFEEDDGASAASRQELARRVAQRTAEAIGFAPARVLLVPTGAIPRTASGKIRHVEVRRRILAGEWKENLP